MTPAQAIASLDRQLVSKKHGQTVTLQKLVSGVVTASVVCPAFVRGYAPEELIGGITQNDMKMIFSPTHLSTGSWGALPSIVPVRGDRVMVAGKAMAVQAAVGVRLNDQIVRVDAQVRG